MRRTIILFLVLLGGGVIFYLTTLTPPAAQGPQGPLVKIGAVDIPVYLARTSDEMQKGLSGRPALDPDKGMLFLFSVEGTYQFWMPDMRFPIDIIWMDAAKKVVSVSADVSNEFDAANPKFYTPSSPVQYVLEVNAGFAAQNDIGLGDKAIFVGI